MNEAQIFIEGLITPETTAQVKLQLAQNVNADSFAIHISSPGGSVYDGYKIFHAIKQAAKALGKQKPVRAVIEGEAQSMATFIACVADKGQIEIANPSVYMIHNPSMEAGGTAADLAKGSEELTKIEAEMSAVYADRTGLPLDKIQEMMSKETRMSASEAVNFGFADKLSTHLRAVAYGKNKMKTKPEKQPWIKKLFASAKPVPKSLDLPLQDGNMLTSDAESEEQLMGSNVTMNGIPVPDGTYTTADGLTISCVAGIITDVDGPATDDNYDPDTAVLSALEAKIAAIKAKKGTNEDGNPPIKTVPPKKVPNPPVPAPTQTAEAQLQAAMLQAAEKLVKLQAEKAAAEKAAAENATALARKEKEVEDLKKQPVGIQDRQGTPLGQGPYYNPAQNRNPYMRKYGTPTADGIKLTQDFLAQEFPWLEEHYKMRGMDTSWFHRGQNSNTPVMTSILQTNFSWTYPGIFTTDLLYKPSIDTPAIADMFTIDQNIKSQKQYNLVQVLSQILQPYFGCGNNGNPSNNDKDLINSATLVTKEFRMEESWCKDDFTQQLTGVYNNLAQEWLKSGELSFDPAGTPIDAIIQEILTDALRRDTFERLTMGSSRSGSVNYNQIDGLWQRLIDSSGASNYCVVRAGSALGTGVPTATQATAAIEACYINSQTILKQQFRKASFWVTGSIYDAYINTLVGTGNVSQPQFENLIVGIDGNKQNTWDGGVPYKGIPVRPVRFWDTSLQNPNNPFFATTRNLVMLTIKENHYAGVENTGDLNKIVSFYHPKDDKRYYRADMKMGYQYMHCDLTTIAY